MIVRVTSRQEELRCSEYAIRRLLWVGPVILGASIVAFTIMHAAPGSRWNREGRQLPPELIERMTAELGLDQPLPVQYVAWLAHFLQGDFGMGASTERFLVAEAVGRGVEPRFSYAGWRFLLAVMIGVPLGLIAALRKDSILGSVATGAALLAMAAPAFALAAFLELVLGAPEFRPEESIFPHAGLETPMSSCCPPLPWRACPWPRSHGTPREPVLEACSSPTTFGRPIRRVSAEEPYRPRSPAPERSPSRSSHHCRLNPSALLITGSIVVERVFGAARYRQPLLLRDLRGRDYTLLMAITVDLRRGGGYRGNAVVDITYGVIDPHPIGRTWRRPNHCPVAEARANLRESSAPAETSRGFWADAFGRLLRSRAGVAGLVHRQLTHGSLPWSGR